ncbi:helix-turn-helix transcriptional regulator [Streptomyces sp. NPDC088554]|uniref:helix-turn-helix transcriptional regulator n=1 Tax=Streptomyces sp. NPDC088554 TaxID=3365865 RepID=UPI0037FE95EA
MNPRTNEPDEPDDNPLPRRKAPPELWQGDTVAWRNRAFLLFDRLPIPVALCDQEGVVLMANPAMASEWGALPSRLRGERALGLFRTAGRERLRPIAEAVRHGRRSRYPVEVSWSAAGGGERHGELTIDLLGDGPDDLPVLLLFLRVREERESQEPPATGAREVGATEKRILALLAGGSTTAQTAREVGLGVDGVNYHLRRLSRRWGVRNRTALVARAYATGVLAAGVWPPESGRAGATGS